MTTSRAALVASFVALASVAACGSAHDSAAPSSTRPSLPALTGKYFEGDDLVVFGTRQSLVLGTTITVSFDQDDTITTHAGCNYFSNRYDVVDGAPRLHPNQTIQTAMGCEQPLMQQDEQVGYLLNGDPVVTLDGDVLVLEGNGRTLRVAAAERPTTAP